MAQLVPVDHDPFDGSGPQFVAVDHDPFAIGNPMGEVYPPQGGNAVQHTAAALASGLRDWVQTPGRAFKEGLSPEEETNWGAGTALGMLGTGAPMAQRGAAGIFGGRLAQTADHAKLARAEEMAGQGHYPDEIWNETGWFQGADKKWRFEIPDNNATMKEFEPGTYSMGDVIDHPDLFKAYPDMKDIYTALNHPEVGGAHGMYTPHESRAHMGLFDTDEMVTARSGYPNDTKETLLHELQHAVQEREGFAKGGTPGWFTQQKDAQLARDALSFRRELEQQPKGRDPHAKENAIIQQYQELGAMDWLPSREARDLAHDIHNNPSSQLEELVKLYRLDKKVTPDTGLEVYKRLAGETEARNVQHRANLTPAERAEMPPWYSQEFQNQDQVIRGATFVPVDHDPFAQ